MRRAAKGRISANYALRLSLAFRDSPSSETVFRVNGKSARWERNRGHSTRGASAQFPG
jgi:hypothetical protein